jgi:crotonobetainyl-CoA:carnitine CoA-transferase CaiB-like acyl-CoA transferase
MNSGDAEGPLSDIRIIAVEQYGAGPAATMHLAALGAEVIKIEDPASRGDIGRYVPPFQDGEDSLFFETYNRGKRSVSLDLANPAGRLVFEDLVRTSDAIFSNLRGDVPAKMRMRYDDLKHLNQALVCCSLSGFGMTGPRTAQPAYDYLIQGLAGWMELTGEPSSPPAKSGLSLVDFGSGYVAAASLIAGIHHSRRTGRGLDCDLSLYDVAVSLLGYVGTWSLHGGPEPHRMSHSAHPSLVPFENFETSDKWIVVACPKEKFWHRLAQAVNRPDLLSDPRFTDFEQRRVHRGELITELSEIFRQATAREWIDRLETAGVPCAPVNDVSQALAEPQAAARGLLVKGRHPKFGDVLIPGSPMRVGSVRSGATRAPFRNEHQSYVLHDILNYPAGKAAELASSGAFGPVEQISGT